MDLGLRNAAAVVVGGSRGMGLATARSLAQEGARVCVLGRSRADLDRAEQDLARQGSPDVVGLVDWANSVGVRSDDPYELMSLIGERYGHPAQMPRAGRPEEIGPVVTFLASRLNSYMTGANVNVDGGSDFS
ncbi:SDR family oxidoreductase [Nocardia jiangxiensis]|uniref:SDR family oxidoreductase n=1 Tax=Nocardia jiangxiensis TaxID=282685 RepID=A0ABW6S929_9NOCA